MDDVELLQLQLKQQLLKEKTKEVETKQKVETEQKPVTFENNLLSFVILISKVSVLLEILG